MRVKNQSSPTHAVPTSVAKNDVDSWDLESGWDDAAPEEPTAPLPTKSTIARATASAPTISFAPFEPVPAPISYVSDSSIPPDVAPAPAALTPPSSPPPSLTAEALANMKLWDAVATPHPGSSDSGTLRPAELVVSLPPPQPAKSVPWAKWAAAAAVLVVSGAGIAKYQATQQAERARAEQAAVHREAKAPAREPSPIATEVSAVAAAPIPEPNTPSEASPAPTAPSEASPVRQVTVLVTPRGSIIFDHGKRIGTDRVQVSVEAGHSKRLVALRDGYLPRRFSVESTDSEVTINLKPAADAANFPVMPAKPLPSK